MSVCVDGADASGSVVAPSVTAVVGSGVFLVGVPPSTDRGADVVPTVLSAAGVTFVAVAAFALNVCETPGVSVVGGCAPCCMTGGVGFGCTAAFGSSGPVASTTRVDVARPSEIAVCVEEAGVVAGAG